MKLSRVKWVASLTISTALALAGGIGFFLREPVLVHWHSRQLEAVGNAEKWDVARRLEELGAKGAKIAEEWYIARLSADVDRERAEAARRLGRMRSARAVPRLLELLLSEDDLPSTATVTWPLACIGALKSIGPPAASATRRRARDPSTVFPAIHVLQSMRLDHRVAIPALGQILTREHSHETCERDTENERRVRAIARAMQGLSHIASFGGPGADEALRTLIGAKLPDRECERRFTRVLLQLVPLGSGAATRAMVSAVERGGERRARGVLMGIASEQPGEDFQQTLSSFVRWLALSDDPETELLRWLLEGCRSELYSIHHWSAGVLAEMIVERPTRADAVIEALIAGLPERSPDIRRREVAALRSIAPALRPGSTSYLKLVSFFSGVLEDPHTGSGIRREASRSLLEMAPETAGDTVIAPLRDLLGSPSAADRTFAISEMRHVLRTLRKPPPRQLFASLLYDPDSSVRIGAAVLLAETVPDDVMPFLVCELRGPSLLSREAVCGVLRGIGPASAPAVPALVGCLEDPSPRVRELAAKTLGSIGAGAAAAVAPLIELLDLPADDAETRSARRSAASALGDIGVQAAAAVPALVEALGDDDFELRRRAVRALGELGPSAASAVPALRRLSEHSYFDDRVTAALESIGGTASPES